jgi:hypothetical protein
MEELMHVGIFLIVAMTVLPLAVLAVVVWALWQRMALTSMAVAAAFFTIIGIELFLLAAYDWVQNDLNYTWGGLYQLTYDMPFIFAASLMLAAATVAIRRQYRRRMDRAAIAPAERAVGSSVSEIGR